MEIEAPGLVVASFNLLHSFAFFPLGHFLTAFLLLLLVRSFISNLALFSTQTVFGDLGDDWVFRGFRAVGFGSASPYSAAALTSLGYQGAQAALPPLLPFWQPRDSIWFLQCA